MNVQKIQEEINTLHYWDSRVTKVLCDHLADEAVVTYEETDGDISYKFLGCYKTIFQHDLGYVKDKPSKELIRGQIPYFIQDVEIGQVEQNGLELYTCKIVMPPMHIEIWCKEIKIETKPKLEIDYSN